jgi:hypothetical protein
MNAYKRRPQWGQDLYTNALILTNRRDREPEAPEIEPLKPWVEGIRVDERTIRRPKRIK